METLGRSSIFFLDLGTIFYHPQKYTLLFLDTAIHRTFLFLRNVSRIVFVI